MKTLDDAGEHLARVAKKGGPVGVVHGEQHLSGGAREPGDTGQTAEHWQANAVGIPRLNDKPGVVDVRAPDI